MIWRSGDDGGSQAFLRYTPTTLDSLPFTRLSSLLLCSCSILCFAQRSRASKSCCFATLCSLLPDSISPSFPSPARHSLTDVSNSERPTSTIYGRPKRGDRRRGPRIHFGLYHLSFFPFFLLSLLPFTHLTKMFRILLLLTLAGRALAGDIAITVQSSAVPDGELPLSWQ